MNRSWDIRVVVTSVALTLIGLLAIYSAGGRQYLTRQLLFLPPAVIGFVVCYLVPRRVLHALAEWIYGVVLLLLGLVLVLGRGAGSERWFVLGPISIQPSEFAKLATVIMLAKLLAGSRAAGTGFRPLVIPVLICITPAILILLEPDLSTATLLAAVLAAMLYWSGLRPLWILALFAPLASFTAGFSLWTWVPFFTLLAIVVLLRTDLTRAVTVLGTTMLAGLLSPILLSVLKEYQRARIRAFLAPWLDPHGVGWNAVQSRIAIGSGRLTGKGFLQGTQSRLGFLPNRHTDFVFSCLGEEFGLLGSLVILALFGILVWRTLVIARYVRDRFASLLCVGCATIIGCQVFTNVGMLLGLLPVTGVALPFVSYGGSSLVLNYMLIGIILNVAARPE